MSNARGPVTAHLRALSEVISQVVVVAMIVTISSARAATDIGSLNAQESLAGDISSSILTDARAEEEARLPAAESGAQSKINEARGLVQQGRYEAAAKAYQDGGAATKDPLRLQWINVQAGECYNRAGRGDDSIAQFNLVIENGPASWWVEEALYRKACLCLKAGRTQDARAAAEHLRIGFPRSKLLESALKLRAQVDGTGTDQLASIYNREQEALALLSTVEARLGSEKPARQEALGVADQIIRQYPETSAAVSAWVTKGQLLASLLRFGDAYNAYTQAIDRTQSIASRSRPERLAKYGQLEAALDRAREQLNDASRKGPTPEAFDKIRADCNLVIQQGRDIKQVASARLVLAETQLVAGKPEETESMMDTLLSGEFAGRRKLERYPQLVLHMHLLAAEGARMRRNYDKALKINNDVKELFAALPKDKQANRDVKQALETAYFQTFLTRCHRPKDRDNLVAAGQEALARCSNPRRAEFIKKWMRPATTGPASQ